MTSSDKKRKWLIYTRVSTVGQTEKYGLDAQINTLTRIAEDRGWDYELLNEGGVSGETIYERPKMIDLLKKVKTGDYEGCLVIEEERLSRSKRLGEWDTIKEAFREGRAKIATPSRILDPENIDDDFMLDISGVLSKREKRVILKRMTRGKAEKLKQGKSIGGTSTPFGYRANKDTQLIEVYPEEKKVYDMLVDWALQGIGIYVMAKKLNEMGIPTRYGRHGWKMRKKPTTNLWRASTIYKILRQEYYTGLKPITFHFTKYHEEEVDLYLPSLITPEKFWQVQHKLVGVESSFRKKSNSYFFMLKGLLKCGLCGRTMYGHGSPKNRKDGHRYVYKFYRCENRNPPPKGTNCPMKSIGQTQIEDAIWKEVLSIAENSEKLALLLKEEDQQANSSINTTKPKLEKFQKLLQEKVEEEERLLTAYRQGVISLDELDKQRTIMNKEKTELTRQVNKLEAEMRSLLFEKGKTKIIKDYIQEVWSKIRDFTTEELFEFYHVCIESIILNYDQEKDRHSIDINFAIPILSQEKKGVSGGGGTTFANFSRGDHQYPQRGGPHPPGYSPNHHPSLSITPSYHLRCRAHRRGAGTETGGGEPRPQRGPLPG